MNSTDGRSRLVAFLTALLLFSSPVRFLFGGDVAAWNETREQVRHLISRCEFEEAHKLVSTFIKSDPQFGPAYELRAWVILDWLDLRDEYALIDVPLRRRTMGDPVNALSNMDLPNEARRRFLQKKFHESYTPPSQLKGVQQDLETARQLQDSRIDEQPIQSFIAEFVGDQSQARKMIKRRIEAGVATPREYLTYGRIAQSERDFANALNAVEIAWRAPETRSQAASRKLSLLLSQHRKKDAEAFFSQWQKVHPDDPRLILIRTSIVTDQNVLFKDFESQLALLPKEESIFFNRATRQAQFRKDADAALADLNRAIELNSNSIVPLYARSCIWNKKGDLRSALNDATAAIACNPYFDVAFELRSKILLKLGDQEAARMDGLQSQWLKRLYELHNEHTMKPDSVDAAFALGDHYARGEDSQEALRVLCKCLKLAPQNAKALRERSRVYRVLGKSELALEDAMTLIEIAPEPGNYGLRGDIYASRREWDEAVQDFERAKFLDRRLELSLRQRAAWHAANGRDDASTEDLARADELSASDIAP